MPLIITPPAGKIVSDGGALPVTIGAGDGNGASNEGSETLHSEMRAIETIVKVLAPLQTDQRDRVIEYAFRHLGITAAPPPTPRGTASPAVPSPQLPTGPVDIRRLREERQPGSAYEMAVLVAYYLAERAPEEERKQAIARADVEKYFKQAQYPLPQGMDTILPKTAAAGYLDALGGGQYKLNPVGYNLAVHGRSEAASATKRRTRKTK